QSDYNGAKVITGVTRSGDTIPAGASTPITITRSGTTATATSTESPHGFENGALVTIEGAEQEEYNGTFTITWVSATQFTFPVSVTGGVDSPATGTLSHYINMANRQVTAVIASGTL